LVATGVNTGRPQPFSKEPTFTAFTRHLLFGLDLSKEGDLVEEDDRPDLVDPTLLPRESGRSTEGERLGLRSEVLFVKTAMSALAFEDEDEARESWSRALSELDVDAAPDWSIVHCNTPRKAHAHGRRSYRARPSTHRDSGRRLRGHMPVCVARSRLGTLGDQPDRTLVLFGLASCHAVCRGAPMNGLG